MPVQEPLCAQAKFKAVDGRRVTLIVRDLQIKSCLFMSHSSSLNLKHYPSNGSVVFKNCLLKILRHGNARYIISNPLNTTYIFKIVSACQLGVAADYNRFASNWSKVNVDIYQLYFKRMLCQDSNICTHFWVHKQHTICLLQTQMVC